jgi:hypothetical protein
VGLEIGVQVGGWRWRVRVGVEHIGLGCSRCIGNRVSGSMVMGGGLAEAGRILGMVEWMEFVGC